MTGQPLIIDGLRKSYGDLKVLDGMSFTVHPGEIYGFVGANGAGKTTTMRIALGVLTTDGGEVRLGDVPLDDTSRRTIGYMPEERGLYPKEKVLDQLIYFARLHGMDAATAKDRAESLLATLNLTERTGDPVEKLSLGNQQRVQIAAALMTDPAALILDEPFSGLDPEAVDSMADLLREQTARGVPVLFSSHQLDLVDRLCDRLVILAGGRVRAQGTPTELRGGAPRRHRLVAIRDAGWVRDIAGLEVVDVDGPVAVLDLAAASEAERLETLERLLGEGLRRGGVTELSPVVPALSEVYREVTA